MAAIVLLQAAARCAISLCCGNSAISLCCGNSAPRHLAAMLQGLCSRAALLRCSRLDSARSAERFRGARRTCGVVLGKDTGNLRAARDIRVGCWGTWVSGTASTAHRCAGIFGICYYGGRWSVLNTPLTGSGYSHGRRNAIVNTGGENVGYSLSPT